MFSLQVTECYIQTHTLRMPFPRSERKSPFLGRSPWEEASREVHGNPNSVAYSSSLTRHLLTHTDTEHLGWPVPGQAGAVGSCLLTQANDK